ncbi:MAG: 4Fe-4S binding protein [Clostridia bacterium]|nr:4Fe-4S binding protein [Clostridia bacterium]
MEYFHSVTLDASRCKGCTSCVKRCPTEAIRVKDGKATIIKERCIDCGECIRVCPHHAKKAVFDKLSMLEDFEYNVALPAPALYGQFNNLDNVDYVLNGLLKIGFDDVFEVARAAELVSEYTRLYLEDPACQKPVISTACPAIVRLIRVRFPKLIPHLLPVRAPVEVAAMIARKEAAEKTGLPAEKIGVFFISPCPAKVTAMRQPLGNDTTSVSGVLSISDVYKPLLSAMNKIQQPLPLSECGLTGISWSYTGGEATALLSTKYLAADGMENVIKILEEIEDDKLQDLEFVELGACVSGCVGGCLTIENPYIARTRVRQLRKYKPVSCNRIKDYSLDLQEYKWNNSIEYNPVMQLDSDLQRAMQKMQEIQRIEKDLPGIDCSACGSPSCHAFAVDVVNGTAKMADCLIILKNRLKDIMD